MDDVAEFLKREFEEEDGKQWQCSVQKRETIRTEDELYDSDERESLSAMDPLRYIDFDIDGLSINLRLIETDNGETGVNEENDEEVSEKLDLN